jgi:hypothetical protein
MCVPQVVTDTAGKPVLKTEAIYMLEQTEYVRCVNRFDIDKNTSGIDMKFHIG